MAAIRGGLLVGGLFAAASGCAAAAPPPAEVAAWIEQLGSPQYAQREAAAKHLAGAGRPALPALGAAIAAGDLEVASRGVEIVRGMMIAEDEELAAAAERLLEQVATSDASAVGRLAEAALEFHQDWRLLPRLRGVACVSVHGVPLDADAIGTLGRVPGVRRIDLFGTTAPDTAVAALVARLPDTLVDVRKGGKLGVSSIVQAGPCHLSAVQPGSAADKAGLRAGDVIVAAAGEPVASFDALTKRLAAFGPGETVRLEVRREGGDAAAEQFVCIVRLDAW